MNTSKLQDGRLIRAGENCPFSSQCEYVSHCNRPKNMGNAFSCGFARGFDLLHKGGAFSQMITVNGDLSPSTSQDKPDLMSFFDGEVVSEEARKPGKPGRNKKRI